MGFLDSVFGKRKSEGRSISEGEQRTSADSPSSQGSKRGSDGYLLPDFWRCAVCRAHGVDESATVQMMDGLFRLAFAKDSCFQELDGTERAALGEFFDYHADPQGGTKEPPSVAARFEDTTGLARDYTGDGFEAVFLCDAHADEVTRAFSAGA